MRTLGDDDVDTSRHQRLDDRTEALGEPVSWTATSDPQGQRDHICGRDEQITGQSQTRLEPLDPGVLLQCPEHGLPMP